MLYGVALINNYWVSEISSDDSILWLLSSYNGNKNAPAGISMNPYISFELSDWIISIGVFESWAIVK